MYCPFVLLQTQGKLSNPWVSWTSFSRIEESQISGPFLIVALLSLVNQWNSEAETWAHDMVAILYHVSADSREFLFQQEFFYIDHFMPKVSASKLKR